MLVASDKFKLFQSWEGKKLKEYLFVNIIGNLRFASVANT